jgi:hypothetical protein
MEICFGKLEDLSANLQVGHSLDLKFKDTSIDLSSGYDSFIYLI